MSGDPARQYLLGRSRRTARQQACQRRPVLVIQADPFNASRLSTTLAAVITPNTAWRPCPVMFPARHRIRPAQRLCRQRNRPGHSGQMLTSMKRQGISRQPS
ncbi:MAG: type II toxin-antitoxin system PemK/MazF family toxin [Streptosporangiaceae bacterium]